ncbi:hypothetical protein ABGB17_32895 [Sphaerisporangium sp. B11E5]|uniref:hypothetical protein n=1 Tax=Sphaerisporangium sp. B11E5 TaxID=3153563 RepID=UPI00325DF8FB
MTVVNTFGIPVMQPQVSGVPRLAYITGTPLCPWRYRGHERLYVPVDETEEAFRHFRGRFGDINMLVRSGHVVVVDGVEGSGKTSLIHRCVHDLRTRLAAELGHPAEDPGDETGLWHPRPAVPGICVIDLSGDARKVAFDNKSQLHPLETINHNIFKRVLIGVRERFPGDATELAELAGDTRSSLVELYQRLRDFLDDRQLFALVILPYIRLGSKEMHGNFLLSYVTFSERRMVFFAETTEPDLMDTVRLSLTWEEENLVTALSIGPLKDKDSESFVNVWQGRPGLTQPHVIISPETVAEVSPEIHFQRVRWLQNSLFQLGEIVCRAGRLEISDHDVRALSEQRRSSPELIRRPRSRRGRGRDER